MKPLKQRVIEDKAFILHTLTELPIKDVLAAIQAKYPQAHYYAPYGGYLFFREESCDWGMRIEVVNGEQILVTWDLEKRLEEYLTKFK